MPPDSNGEYPADLVVACPGGPSFPLSALDDIPLLNDADPGGVAEAIASFLDSEEGDFWPQDGWRILHMTDDEVILLARTPEGPLAFMYVAHQGAGWAWSGSSMAGEECPLQFTVPEDLNTVQWRLDPEAPELTPATTEISVILNERECVGGIEIGDRLVGPQVVLTESQVFLAFAAARPPGDAFTCQGNPDTPYIVELPEPLGDRELVQGLDIGITLDDYVD